MASANELLWWDQFADVMAKQWNLTPTMNQAIRSEYERDYEAYLFVAGGRLLDVGCGTGMRTHGLARRGMLVDGIDFSASQLNLARELAEKEGVGSMEFFQRDIVNEHWNGRYQQYDSAFVNALLHHLSYDELGQVMAEMARILKPGGKAYLYEPVVKEARSPWRHIVFVGVNELWRIYVGAFVRIGRGLGMFDHELTSAMKKGYTGTSPDEHAIDFDKLRASFEGEFRLVECRPFHEYSIGYGMSLMLVKEPWRQKLERFAKHWYRLDQWLFRRGMWDNAGTNKRWTLCAIKLEKKKAGQT
jgi:SAM-dependent methyltransferase